MAGPITAVLSAKTVLGAVGAWMSSGGGQEAAKAVTSVIGAMGDKRQRLGAIKMLATQKAFEAKALREILLQVEGDSVPKDALFVMHAAVSERLWDSVKQMADLDTD